MIPVCHVSNICSFFNNFRDFLPTYFGKAYPHMYMENQQQINLPTPTPVLVMWHHIYSISLRIFECMIGMGPNCNPYWAHCLENIIISSYFLSSFMCLIFKMVMSCVLSCSSTLVKIYRIPNLLRCCLQPEQTMIHT